MKVATVSEMREMDRAALQQYGISAEILMENAGHGAYAVLSKEAGLWRKKVVVLCGPGNNGGDGFVTARKIHSGGGDVTVLILGEKNEYQGAAGKNLDILSRMPVEIRPVASVEEIGRMAERADFLIDALFGTGLSREVEGIYKEAIPWLNGSGKKILSLDIPSGISGDTGHIMGVAVRANYTVTFGLPKVGNLLYPGYEHCGKLYVTHISFPP
ncbi:MAG: NAD(P)H-hydrate epimerase, partial [Deltaproteobacteria bacterium]